MRRVEDGRGSLVIERRGTPRAVLPIIGEESKRKRTDTLTSRQIDQVITATRVQKPKRG